MKTRNEILNEAKSERGGWSRASLAKFGIGWPPPRGWFRELRRKTPEQLLTMMKLASESTPPKPKRAIATHAGSAVKNGFRDYNHYLESAHWKELRRQLFEARPGCCACGGTSSRVGHHKRYRNLIDVEVSDLATMCFSCHDDFHMACRRKGIPCVEIEDDSIRAIVAEFRATPFYAKWVERKERKRLRLPRAHAGGSQGLKRRLKKVFKQFLRGDLSSTSVSNLSDSLNNLIRNF